MWLQGLLPNMMAAHGEEFPDLIDPEALEYGLERYGMETRRLLSVLNLHLSDGRDFIAGDEFTVADMATVPWISDLLVRFFPLFL